MLAIDTSKSISSVTYNGVNIPLAGGGSDFKPCPQDLNDITEEGIYYGDSGALFYRNSPGANSYPVILSHTFNGDVVYQLGMFRSRGIDAIPIAPYIRFTQNGNFGNWLRCNLNPFQALVSTAASITGPGLYHGYCSDAPEGTTSLCIIAIPGTYDSEASLLIGYFLSESSMTVSQYWTYARNINWQKITS